jgi:hypothetical protein
MVRKEQIKLSVGALYLENIKKDKSFLSNKTKLINNLNLILENGKMRIRRSIYKSNHKSDRQDNYICILNDGTTNNILHIH